MANKPKELKIRILRGCTVDAKDYAPNETLTVDESLARQLVAIGRAKIDDGKEVKVPQPRHIEKAVGNNGAELAELNEKLKATDKAVKELEKLVADEKKRADVAEQEAEKALAELEALKKSQAGDAASNGAAAKKANQ